MAKREVAKAKEKAYTDLHVRLVFDEGEKVLIGWTERKLERMCRSLE